MADVTQGGKEAVERDLKRRERKAQIEVFRLQAQTMEAQLEIDTRQQQLDEALVRLAEKQAELESVRKDMNSNG